MAHSRIVYADDDADGSIFSIKVPGMLTLRDAPASAIVPQLAPRMASRGAQDTPSAFYGTMLAAWLAQRGVQTLLVAGATTSGCVARQRGRRDVGGFRPLMLSDCVGDRALGPHEGQPVRMRQKYAAVMTHDEALAKDKVTHRGACPPRDRHQPNPEPVPARDGAYSNLGACPSVGTGFP